MDMERFEEITALSYHKSDFYRLAYKYLSAALELENINFSILSPAVLKEKVQKVFCLRAEILFCS